VCVLLVEGVHALCECEVGIYKCVFWVWRLSCETLKLQPAPGQKGYVHFQILQPMWVQKILHVILLEL
jgi:hypothetical protein